MQGRRRDHWATIVFLLQFRQPLPLHKWGDPLRQGLGSLYLCTHWSQHMVVSIGGDFPPPPRDT